MKYVVLDLEATCWAEKGLKRKSEIIEIGALSLDVSGELTGEFSRFVKPTLHPEISAFCTELTSITQTDVDAAQHFPEVLAAFQTWIGVGQNPYYLCSWGFYDRNQLQQDCELHRLGTAWLQPHISLKHQHFAIKNLKRPMGMAGALYVEGFTLDGTHHRGIDDARNIVKIFRKYLGQWNFEQTQPAI